MEKRFQRRRENFQCEQCQIIVGGNGYTNHCPNCLWSKHVDINPGDRKAKCGGLMKPIGLDWKNKTYIIVHHCLNCGLKKRNKISKNDKIDRIIQITAVTQTKPLRSRPRLKTESN
ncbi:MAG: RNHCP domain-containing protein [Patescibacteria group bacterium]|nr:RNHCP domain-containing protein [Patescibacteria group bacterium]